MKLRKRDKAAHGRKPFNDRALVGEDNRVVLIQRIPNKQHSLSLIPECKFIWRVTRCMKDFHPQRQTQWILLVAADNIVQVGNEGQRVSRRSDAQRFALRMGWQVLRIKKIWTVGRGKDRAVDRKCLRTHCIITP